MLLCEWVWMWGRERETERETANKVEKLSPPPQVRCCRRWRMHGVQQGARMDAGGWRHTNSLPSLGRFPFKQRRRGRVWWCHTKKVGLWLWFIIWLRASAALGAVAPDVQQVSPEARAWRVFDKRAWTRSPRAARRRWQSKWRVWSLQSFRAWEKCDWFVVEMPGHHLPRNRQNFPSIEFARVSCTDKRTSPSLHFLPVNL